MLGEPKSRHLDEPILVSLDDLVPKSHVSRHLERTLDLTFVRALVRAAYAENGRPSIDPVVFFKLQMILFFEGLRSERQLMRVVADRLSLRVLSRVRSERVPARPLEPDPHPRTVRGGGVSPLLRGDRRAMHRSGSGLGPGAGPSTRPMSRPMRRSTRCTHALRSRRTSPSSSTRTALARTMVMLTARTMATTPANRSSRSACPSH